MDEGLELSLAAELVTEYTPYAADETDDAKIVQLSPIPASLAAELDAFEHFRTSQLNCLRHGAKVGETTFAGDRASCLRFLNYLRMHKGQAEPSLSLLACAEVGAWAQSYMQHLLDNFAGGEVGAKSHGARRAKRAAHLAPDLAGEAHRDAALHAAAGAGCLVHDGDRLNL